MAVVVGINIAVGLRLAGVAASIPLPPLRRFYPLHWLGVAAILLSGVGLLIAYPAKALTNPLFYAKLVALTTALLLSRYFELWLGRERLGQNTVMPIRLLAILSLVLWVITITGGRFLAYTNTVLLASRFY